jgi:putative peptide zinc metalloprotease protein
MSDTFSESWHRIAGRRIALRSGVRARRQFFRGERWHVLYEPFSNQYFRVRSGAWDFLSRLDEGKTVQQCWEECLAQQPTEAPGQEEVIQLLAQLYQANLIRSDLAPDAARLFEKHQKRRRREMRTRLLSLLFIRIPLWDPDAFLERTLPLVKWLFSWFGALLWLGVVGWGLKTAVEHGGDLWAQGQSVLSPGNLGWLYLSLVLLKLLHELGHAYTCRYFGGQIHVFGVMLMVLSPLPFVDATSAWSFRERRKRVLVGAAGMVVELFIAALAALVWAGTGKGVVNAVAYNVMFIASVSTLLANANPLLRFDGYYILCDLIGVPNLNQRATRLWVHWIEKGLFGYRKAVSPAASRREAVWLGIYGAASWVYRTVLFGGIILFVAGQWLLLGAIMAVIGVVTWGFVPLGKLVHYLGSSPKLQRTRRRAILVTAGAAAGLVALLGLVPVPDRFTAPGIVRGENYTMVFTDSEGWYAELLAPSGTRVEPGQPLLRLRNQELELERESARAEEAEIIALERSALNQPGEGLEAVRERLKAVRQRQALITRLLEDLELRAPAAGLWVAPPAAELAGRWLPRGAVVGEILDPGKLYFSAVVKQEDAANLFGKELKVAGVRLKGEAATLVPVTGAHIIPTQQEMLPSAALGLAGGGDIAIRQDDKSGTRSAEPFFELRANLDTGTPAQLRHGRSGELRCELPWRPLLSQWYRSLRQLLQRRFQV